MFVYADNAATTCVSKTAREAMMPYLTERYGNPSSLYAFAQIVTEDLANARATVAQCINAARDILHLRRQRGGQSGHNFRREARCEEGQEAHHLHQV